jgi:hypothetical protein
MWKNMIFWLWITQQGTSSLHREMERPSEKISWGEEKLSITMDMCYWMLNWSS